MTKIFTQKTIDWATEKCSLKTYYEPKKFIKDFCRGSSLLKAETLTPTRRISSGDSARYLSKSIRTLRLIVSLSLAGCSRVTERLLLLKSTLTT